MLHITICAIGKLGQDWLRQGCGEYAKRLAPFCKLNVIELPEHRLPEKPSAAQIAQALEAEGKAMLAKIPPGSFVAALCVEGEGITSEELAQTLTRLPVQGVSSLCFLIGSSHGLAQECKAKARLRLSLSGLTFTHQLARLLLLEQLYRGFCIAGGIGYHK